MTREDFVLPTLGPKLDAIHKDLIFGAQRFTTCRFNPIICAHVSNLLLHVSQAVVSGCCAMFLLDWMSPSSAALALFH